MTAPDARTREDAEKYVAEHMHESYSALNRLIATQYFEAGAQLAESKLREAIGIKVDALGIRFGEVWISHVAILGHRGPIVTYEYNRWLKAALAAENPEENKNG
jgi:hypothetical protein